MRLTFTLSRSLFIDGDMFSQVSRDLCEHDVQAVLNSVL